MSWSRPSRCVVACTLGRCVVWVVLAIGLPAAAGASGAPGPTLASEPGPSTPFGLSTPFGDDPREEPPAEHARRELAALLAELHTVSARFSQQIYGARGELLEESNGKMYLRGTSFRWQVEAPFPQIIIADEQRLRVFDPDLNQVIERPIDDALENTPIAVITDARLALDPEYVVHELRGADDTGDRQFEVEPVAEDSLYRSFRLRFSATGLAELEIVDQFGQTTRVRFSAVDTEAALSDDVFMLDLPVDVEVIRG